MDRTWDLSVIYRGFDDPAFLSDLAALDEAVRACCADAARADSMTHGDAVRCYIRNGERLTTLVSRLAGYAMLRTSADTGDTDAMSMLDRVMEKLSAVSAADAGFRRRIASFADLDALIDADPALSEYRFLLGKIREDSRYLLSEGEEALFARLDLSGASAWSKLQQTLTSTVRASYRGEEIPLSAVRNLAYDPDPAVRRDAYEAELASYAPIAEAVAFSLNSIKQQVLTECSVRGFDSPLDQALHASRMRRETLDALLCAMKEYMPVFRRYLRAKGRALGHPDGLPWYDLFAPMGKNDTKYTVEDAERYLLDVFARFDPALHDMVRRAFGERWIDFFPRPGKVGGAFDHGMPAIGQSRVLTNFDGSFSDVMTLAHELGHAFHDQQVFPNAPLNQEYSMPVAETASNFNELLVGNTALSLASDPDVKLALLESQVSDLTQIICDIYSRYLFESAVFARRPEEFMNAQRLCEMMLEAQKEAYGDGLDPAVRHPYMWACKSHYYSGGLSFYNFPYAFGGLFARGLYARYCAEGASFVPAYKALLRATATTTVEGCAAMAGIDLTDPAFWRTGLETAAKDIDTLIGLMEP